MRKWHTGDPAYEIGGSKIISSFFVPDPIPGQERKPQQPDEQKTPLNPRGADYQHEADRKSSGERIFLGGLALMIISGERICRAVKTVVDHTILLPFHVRDLVLYAQAARGDHQSIALTLGAYLVGSKKVKRKGENYRSALFMGGG